MSGAVDYFNLEAKNFEKNYYKKKRLDTKIAKLFYPSNKAVKDGLNLKVDKTRTIIGLDLQNNISLNDFKVALGKTNVDNVKTGQNI